MKITKKTCISTVFLITAFALNNSYATSAAQQLTFDLPDGEVVIKKPNDAPYCAEKGSCDFPIDCYGNLGAPPKGKMWACKNAPRACIGQCYLAPASTIKDKMQKVLNILASGDATA